MNGTSRGPAALERLVQRNVRRRRDLIAEATSRQARVAAVSLAALVRARPNHAPLQSIVFTGSVEAIPELGRAIEQRLVPGTALTTVTLSPDSDARREENLIARNPDIVVTTPGRLIDHIRRDNIDLSGVVTVAIDVPSEETIEQFSADLHFIYAKLERRPVTIALVRDLGREFDLLEDLLRRPTTVSDDSWATPTTRPSPSQERSMKDLPFDPDQLKSRVDEIIHAIHHDEDPVELTQYRDHARRYTTLFNRGYVLAYLLKQSMEGGRPPRGGRGDRSRAKEPARGGEPTKEPSQDTQSIFVSIGRSKRVRSRDLVTFFTSADGISQDDIGQVKVLDNYSFVEVATAKAQAAIDELNGKELRGRKLTVNYARRK